MLLKKRNILLAALAAAAMAQAPPEDRPNVGEKLKQNAEALKTFEYKRRTEVSIKDQPRGSRTDLVRYVNGKMETVPLETPARQAQGGRRGGIRGKMMQKKGEEMKEEVQQLTALVHSYLPSESDSMRSAFEKAQISRTSPEPDSDIKLVAKGVVKPSDSFTLVWSVANHRPVKSEIHADLDGKPVGIVVEFAALPDGPFYPARIVVSVPKKDLAIKIDTFDYTHTADASRAGGF